MSFQPTLSTRSQRLSNRMSRGYIFSLYAGYILEYRAEKSTIAALKSHPKFAKISDREKRQEGKKGQRKSKERGKGTTPAIIVAQHTTEGSQESQDKTNAANSKTYT